jgi:DNA-binding FadR family transcriptional regulator
MKPEHFGVGQGLVNEGGGTLVDRIHASVLDAILRGEFTQGARLPTEGELAERFGVSRATVREALSRLRSDGIIETRRGSGSHVSIPPARAASGAPVPTVASLADVERYYAFRECIESGAAAAAAEWRDADDLKALRDAFERLRDAMESGRPSAEDDLRFHAAIARATHNPFFITAMGDGVAPIRQYMDRFNSAKDEVRPARVRAALAEHQAILDAIVQRSPAQAAAAMREHVFNTRLRLFEGMRLG